ncbi:MAG: hypothetical protein IT208_04565 [Chthonomonadales bacterium]|nr:hypothetical protein [Chthonomonadales bacterium]
MSGLTLSDAIAALGRSAAAICDAQVTAAGRPDAGAILRADWGIADPGGTAGLLAVCAHLLAARALHPGAAPCAPNDDTLLARSVLAAAWLERAQRPSGCIDLLDCNYDSAPDAAFAVQNLAAAVELGRPLASRSPRWASLLAAIERFLRRAVGGMVAGGFHTPNHRWVIAAALAQAGALYPDLDVTPTVTAYVAEGFDLDADGAFIERSPAVYDGICDRSLMLLAAYTGCKGAIEAARANLEWNLHLLHADGTTETGLSRRQDHGTRAVPYGLVAPLLLCDAAQPTPHLRAAARFLWEQGAAAGQQDGLWAWYAMQRHGEPGPTSPDDVPASYRRWFPANGLWRLRRGPLSASAFRGRTALLGLRYGQAELTAIRASLSYFGVGNLSARAAEERGAGLRAELAGEERPHRPGYELPLGRPVAPDAWRETISERDWIPSPHAAAEMEVREAPDGIDLALRTPHEPAGVTAQVALDFAPGGTWETGDICLRPTAGQTIFLKAGEGTMRWGHDVIAVGPGAHAHRMWRMRDTEAAPESVRVLLTFITPFEHVLRVRCHREP